MQAVNAAISSYAAQHASSGVPPKLSSRDLPSNNSSCIQIGNLQPPERTVILKRKGALRSGSKGSAIAMEASNTVKQGINRLPLVKRMGHLIGNWMPF